MKRLHGSKKGEQQCAIQTVLVPVGLLWYSLQLSAKVIGQRWVAASLLLVWWLMTQNLFSVGKFYISMVKFHLMLQFSCKIQSCSIACKKKKKKKKNLMTIHRSSCVCSTCVCHV